LKFSQLINKQISHEFLPCGMMWKTFLPNFDFFASTLANGIL